jgi:hypothetical protein
MKKLLLILSFFSFYCNAQLMPGVAASGSKSFVSIALPDDYVEWNPHTVNDDQPTGDADFFWHNSNGVGLRASLHYSGTQYSIVDGEFRFYIHPRDPDPGVIGDIQRYNYRAEIARRATVTIPVGSREIVKCTYRIPSGGFKPRDTGFNIGQWHTGTGVGGPYPLNSPVISLDIAKANTPDKDSDLSQLNELVVVNSVSNFENSHNGRKNTGIVLEAGMVFSLRQELISGTGSAGYYKLEIKVGTDPWQTIYEEHESTIWAEDDDGGSKSNVHPYWKLGLYQYGLVTEGGVEATEALNDGEGSYDIEIFMPNKIKTAVFETDDRYFNSTNIIKAFN